MFLFTETAVKRQLQFYGFPKNFFIFSCNHDLFILSNFCHSHAVLSDRHIDFSTAIQKFRKVIHLFSKIQEDNFIRTVGAEIYDQSQPFAALDTPQIKRGKGGRNIVQIVDRLHKSSKFTDQIAFPTSGEIHQITDIPVKLSVH